MKCEIMRWHLTFEQQSGEHECEGCNHQKQMKNVKHHLILVSKCPSLSNNEVVNNNVKFGNIERKWKLKEKMSRSRLGWSKKC